VSILEYALSVKNQAEQMRLEWPPHGCVADLGYIRTRRDTATIYFCVPTHTHLASCHMSQGDFANVEKKHPSVLLH
jgi:hypothetical protein